MEKREPANSADKLREATNKSLTFFIGSDFTQKLELNSPPTLPPSLKLWRIKKLRRTRKKGFKLFYKKLLKAPAPAFKSNNFPAGKARL